MVNLIKFGILKLKKIKKEQSRVQDSKYFNQIKYLKNIDVGTSKGTYIII